MEYVATWVDPTPVTTRAGFSNGFDKIKNDEAGDA